MGEILRSAGLFVCLSVLVSVRVSQKPNVQISLDFLCMLPVAAARRCSDYDVMHYVVYFRFSPNGANAPKSSTALCFVELVTNKVAVCDCRLVSVRCSCGLHVIRLCN